MHAQDEEASRLGDAGEYETSLAEQIAQLLEEQDPLAARELLKEATRRESRESRTESRMIQLSNMHHSIAFGFYRQGEYGEATEELAMSFDSVSQYPDTLRKAFTLANIVDTMKLFYARSGKENVFTDRLDLAIEYCRDLETDYFVKIQYPLSELVVTRAKMPSRDDLHLARDMLTKQIATIDTINSTEKATERTIASQFRLLSAAGSVLDGFDNQVKLEELLEAGLASFPESDRIIREFARAELEAVSNLARKDPVKASKRLMSATDRLRTLAETNDNVQRMMESIPSLEQQIAATKKQQNLLGKLTPTLDFDGWANADRFSVNDLKGKVVLYDFWAAWCGPCLRTFPHLREWREEFGEKGFEIVGITRYYDYVWDEESGKATRSAERVDPKSERTAIAKFLQAKQMKHPTIFAPEDSTLLHEYGVKGIPHYVLVDRDGIIRMIKVGSGEENVDALYDKIRELVGQ